MNNIKQLFFIFLHIPKYFSSKFLCFIYFEKGKTQNHAGLVSFESMTLSIVLGASTISLDCQKNFTRTISMLYYM